VTFFASVVDKAAVQAKYPKPHYAAALAYEFLVQRIVFTLGQNNLVRVVIDDMDGATPKGNQYRENLKRQHKSLLRNGSSYQDGLEFGCLLPKIIFVDSATSHAMQVADCVAYHVNKQFKLYGQEWDKGMRDDRGVMRLSTHEEFAFMVKRFCRGPQDRIQGFGLVKFPKDPTGPVWRIEQL